MSAVDVLMQRLAREEGRKEFAYNDATGQRVTCKPNGNLTIAIGVNLEVGLDDDEIDWLSRHRVEKVETQLVSYAWYQIDEVRQSVLLDMAFNQGVAGLLHYPHMLSAIAQKDWMTASIQCAVADPKLDASRYAPLRQILLSGVSP